MDLTNHTRFEIVRNNKFEIETNNIIFNDSLQIMLKVNGKINLCQNEMFATTEGLYIIKFNDKIDELISKLSFNHRTLTELTTINDLILTDSDFKTRQLLIINKLINLNLCHLQQSVIVSFTSHIDKYHSIQIKNEKLILYSNGIYNNIYIPDCIPINEIRLIETIQHCYKEIPIQFQILNTTKIGFLTSNLIIKDTSLISLCNNTNDYTILPKSSRIIERKNGLISILPQTNENILKLSLLSISTNTLNFQHNIQITEGIDIISQFQQIVLINDTGSLLKIIEDGPSTLLKSNILTQSDFQFSLAKSLMHHLFWYIVIILITLLLKIMIIYFLIKCIINCIKNKISTFKNTENNSKHFSWCTKINNLRNANRQQSQSETPKNEIELEPLTSRNTDLVLNKDEENNNKLKELTSQLKEARKQFNLSHSDSNELIS